MISEGGTELEVIIPAYFCPVVSSCCRLPSNLFIAVRTLWNGFVAFFYTDGTNYIALVAPGLCHQFTLQVTVVCCA
jgi:hypothetical protein